MKLAVAVVVGAGLLCACSGGGAVAGNTSAAVSSAPSRAVATAAAVSPSPSIPTTGPNLLPGATVPVMPAEAKQHTARGALVFAASIVQALDWAYSTTDSTILKQYYAPECSGCKGSIEAFDSVARQASHYKGGHISLVKISQKSSVPQHVIAEYAFDVELKQTSLTLIDQAGLVQQGPTGAQDVTIEYSVSWIDGWKVSDSARLVRAK